uniref:BRCT domain-containing protein n=1 Tax=Haemonchus contortus TaxID=6289 RepID=A0A7I4YF69_HAECO
MTSRFSSRGWEGSKSQKRKRGLQPDVPRLLRSPCNKSARPGTYTVFLCGFNDREKRELQKHCAEGIIIKELLSTSVTHVIVKPPTRRDRGYLYSALYYAVVSGAWLLRPSWILSSKNGIGPESEHEISSEDDSLHPTKFEEILSLYHSIRSSSIVKCNGIFSDEVFRRVFVLTGRTNEGKLKKAALRSLINAGGGQLVTDDVWRVVREKPCKAAGLISMIVIGNGEGLNSHDINLSFVKQLLTQCVPILYEEMLSQILFNQVVPNLEIMMTHAIYYWCNEHPQKLKLSNEDIECIREIQRQSGGDDNQNITDDSVQPEKTEGTSHESTSSATTDERYLQQEPMSGDWMACDENLLNEMEEEIKENEQKGNHVAELSAAVEEEQRSVVIIDAEERSSQTEVEDDCGLFEMVDLKLLASEELAAMECSWSDGMAKLSHLVPKALARSGVESASIPDNLKQFFDAILDELGHNIPTSFIHDFICFQVVNSLQNSLHPSLLPTPDLLSRLFCEIAKPEYGQQFDAANSAYRLLMYFLYQFPPCNSEGRFYWLQVLTADSSSESEPSTSTGRRGSVLKGSDLISRVAEFRKMVVDTFTEDGVNHNLMELLVSVLEVDLFNMEGCDGLDTSKDDTEECDIPNRLSLSARNEQMLEQTQNSSILDNVPLSYLVFYDPLERRKRGLDRTAIETCFAIVDKALSTTSIISSSLCWRLLAVCLEGLQFCLAETVKLFKREQISIDLQMDIERLGRYLIKRGLSLEEIRQHIRVGWIHNTIAAMS